MRELRLTRPDGATLRAFRGDDAPRDVVLLHGFPFDARQWESQLRELSEAARVLVPELRGLGGSDLGPRGAASMSDHADDVAAWMDEVGMERAVLGGLSMGGYVAFEVWWRHRHRIAALILADTKAEEDPPEGKQARIRMAETIRVEGMQAVAEEMLTKVLGESTHRSRRLARAIQGSNFVEVEGAGHVSSLEAPAAVTAALRRFLSGL